MNNDVVVTRNNFKNMRLSYGIKLKDISEKCGVSESCINNFENSTGSYMDTNARDYNKSKICRTLQELIETKILHIYDKPEEVKEVEVKNEDAHVGYGSMKRELFVKKIRQYCANNDFSLRDFQRMCDISTSTLYTKNPFVGKVTVDKVLKATGLTREEFFEGNQQKKVTENKEPAQIVTTKKDIPEVSKVHKKLTAANGKYYEEYDVYQFVKHVSTEISKEEFLRRLE